MQRIVRRLFPSMFSRRLLFLILIAFGTTVTLAIQTTHLTISQGGLFRHRIEQILVRHHLIPTLRGAIYDRNDRLLAKARSSYNVSVGFDVLSGRWVEQCARRQAIKENKDEWRQLTARQRLLLLEKHQVPFRQQVSDLWKMLIERTAIDPVDLERRKAQIIRAVHRGTDSYQRRQIKKLEAKSGGQIPLAEVAGESIAEQNQFHVVISDVDRNIRFDLDRMIGNAHNPHAVDSSEPNVWKRVQMGISSRRDYPYHEMQVTVDRSTLPSPLSHHDTVVYSVNHVARHVVGRMRHRVWEQERQAYPYHSRSTSGQSQYNLHGYLFEDPIGAWGIERSMERHLRGRRGWRSSYRDEHTVVIHEPVAGDDVKLTIDIQLQALVAAIMDPEDATLGLMRSRSWHKKPTHKKKSPKDGEALCGAAIVMDIASGEVLAAVSSPWQVPENIATDRQAIKRWEQVNSPWRNRVVGMPYPPGSTVKPLILAAGYTDGKLGYNQTLPCVPGYLDPSQPHHLRCWYYVATNGEPHPNLTGPEAVMRSCNMFFYRLGQRLGTSALGDWYDRFRLGHLTRCGLPEEIRTHGASGVSADTVPQMAIGQGPIEWTLVQAAGAYAILARGGVVHPTFIKTQDGSELSPGYLKLDPRGIELALEGMRLSATDRNGTTSVLRLPELREPIFNIPDVEIYAKSGTAQAPPLRINIKDQQGIEDKRIVREGNHGWVICLVKRPQSIQPDFVIAVIVEYGGSGGQVGGPIVNQILHAMRSCEYL